MPIDSERLVENHLRKRVRAMGGEHRKVVYQGRRGSPDDWCFFPGGRLLIVECKTTGEKPSRHQAQEIAWLQSMGFDARVVDSVEAVDLVLADYEQS